MKFFRKRKGITIRIKGDNGEEIETKMKNNSGTITITKSIGKVKDVSRD